MRLLILPSWYPSERAPMAGRFVHDQAVALRVARPDLQLAVLGWGHGDGALSLRDAGQSLSALAWRAGAGRGARWIEGEVPCAWAPALSWTLNWRDGNLEGQYRACRQAFLMARERWGGVDLVHAHVSLPAGVIARRLSREFGLPYVLTEHMGPFPFPALQRPGGRLHPALAPVFADAAAVLAVSPRLAADVRGHGLRCDGVMPNVVDERRFPPLPPPDGPWTLLALASLLPIKGLDLLLRAWARRGPALAAARLRIAGDGPERAALQALARALGLEGQVEWLGGLHPGQVPQALVGAHALVLPSRHETFGVVLAEALMAGRPVLATRCGGPEAVVGADDGLLVPVEDVDALAAGLDGLPGFAAGHPERQPQALRVRAQARWGLQAVGGALATLYQEVLSGGGRA